MWYRTTLAVLILGCLASFIAGEGLKACRHSNECPECKTHTENLEKRVKFCDGFGWCRCETSCQNDEMCRSGMERDPELLCNKIPGGLRTCNMSNPNLSHCTCNYMCNRDRDCHTEMIQCSNPHMMKGCHEGRCMCLNKNNYEELSSSMEMNAEMTCMKKGDCAHKNCPKGRKPSCLMMQGKMRCHCVQCDKESDCPHCSERGMHRMCSEMGECKCMRNAVSIKVPILEKKEECTTTRDCLGTRRCPMGKRVVCGRVDEGIRRCQCAECEKMEDCPSCENPHMMKMCSKEGKCMCLDRSEGASFLFRTYGDYAESSEEQNMNMRRCHKMEDCKDKTCEHGKKPACFMMDGVKRCKCIQCDKKQECPPCREERMERKCSMEGMCMCKPKMVQEDNMKRCHKMEDCRDKTCMHGMRPACFMMDGDRRCKCIQCEKKLECPPCKEEGMERKCSMEGMCMCKPKQCEAHSMRCTTPSDCPPSMCHEETDSNNEIEMSPKCVKGRCMCPSWFLQLFQELQGEAGICQGEMDCRNTECPEGMRAMCKDKACLCMQLPTNACDSRNDCPRCTDSSMKRICLRKEGEDFKTCDCIQKTQCMTSRDCNEENGIHCGKRFLWWQAIVTPSCCVKCGEREMGECRCDAGGRLGFCPNGRDGFVHGKSC